MGRRFAVGVCIAALFGLAAVAAIASSGAGGGAPAAAAFRLDDGSAACNYRESGEIACREAGTDGAVVLRPDGESELDPDADVAWDDSTPVLLATESWWNGSVSCRVASGRIACSSGGGAIMVGARGDAAG